MCRRKGNQQPPPPPPQLSVRLQFWQEADKSFPEEKLVLLFLLLLRLQICRETTQRPRQTLQACEDADAASETLRSLLLAVMETLNTDAVIIQGHVDTQASVCKIGLF
ncbi:hypothetical protein ABVT39_026963 [Epinephelus coioides]